MAGFCLMSNHVHLVVIPHYEHGLALVLKDTHGRYAAYWNAVHQSSGHAWQGRYFSCPLDGVHLWETLRCKELNAVRAGMVDEARSLDVVQRSSPLRNGAREPNRRFGIMAEPLDCQCLAAVSRGGEIESRLAAIRQCTHTGRPLGSEEFVQALEESMKRSWLYRREGALLNLIWMRGRASLLLKQTRLRSVICCL